MIDVPDGSHISIYEGNGTCLEEEEEEEDKEDDFLASMAEKGKRRKETGSRGGQEPTPILLEGRALLGALQGWGEDMRARIGCNFEKLLEGLKKGGGSKRKKDDDWKSEDKVTFTEVVEVVDNSHDKLCWKIRNVLRNPNGLPADWWDKEVLNKTSPMLGANLVEGWRRARPAGYSTGRRCWSSRCALPRTADTWGPSNRRSRQRFTTRDPLRRHLRQTGEDTLLVGRQWRAY